MVNEEYMQAALADCDLSEDPNYTEIAKKHHINRLTLSRRHQDITRSRAQFLSESVQCLTKAQEETLISYINRMTNRNMPPTTQIVRNLAEEIIQNPVGKN